MKELRFRFFIILAAIALSIYLLYPTYADYQNSQKMQQTLNSIRDSIKQVQPGINEDELEQIITAKEDSILVANPKITETREKRVKLGLDLQGGMYLVMEVNTSKLLERIAKDPDENFRQILQEAKRESDQAGGDLVELLAEKLEANGIRLSRYFGNIRQDDQQIIDNLKEQQQDAVTRAIEIIRNRVDQYGVSEPTIQKQGARRIIVELPGVAKEEQAKRLLQGRALLEFKLVKQPDFAVPIMNKIDEVLAASIGDTTSIDTTTGDTTSVEDMSEEEFAQKHPFYSVARVNPESRVSDAFVKEGDKNKVTSYLNRPEVQNVIPNNVEFLFSNKPITTLDEVNYYRLYMVNKEPDLTGGVIDDATANINKQTSEPIVSMQMNADGARDWARITGANVDRRIAIVLDNVVYSAPVVNEKIPSGRSQISGMANMDEAKLLEIVLKAGALPAPIDIIEERTVGPSLGQDSITKGFRSAIIGLVIVVFFIVLYYRKSGTISDISLLFTVLFIFGILAGFHATLTLPGIAGIILTIGMAVDANVLIFERVREELTTGKTAKAAVDSGFANSYSAILDANITTFFTGIILYQFGSGPVQGFALTLMIGILASLFSALVITRIIFDYFVAKGSKITIG